MMYILAPPKVFAAPDVKLSAEESLYPEVVTTVNEDMDVQRVVRNDRLRPSLAMSRDDDREDFPSAEPPRDGSCLNIATFINLDHEPMITSYRKKTGAPPLGGYEPKPGLSIRVSPWIWVLEDVEASLKGQMSQGLGREMHRIFWLYLTTRRWKGVQRLTHSGLKGLERNTLFSKRVLEILMKRAMLGQAALAAVRPNCGQLQSVQMKQLRLRRRFRQVQENQQLEHQLHQATAAAANRDPASGQEPQGVGWTPESVPYLGRFVPPEERANSDYQAGIEEGLRILNPVAQSAEWSNATVQGAMQGDFWDSDACIAVSDWLTQIQPIMSDLSERCWAWWQRVMEVAQRAYVKWQQAGPLEKSLIVCETPPDLLDPRLSRLEARALGMILESLPSRIKDELVVTKALTSPNAVFRILLAFQPGGLGERQKLISNLQETQHQLDFCPTVTSVTAYARLLQAEMETLALSGADLEVEEPTKLTKKQRAAALRKEQAANAKAGAKGGGDAGATAGNDSNATGQGKGGQGAGKGAPSATNANGDNTAGGKAPCKFYAMKGGCKMGRTCWSHHDFGKASAEGRCFTCGSTEHRADACHRPQGKRGAKGEDVRQVTAEESATNASSSSGGADPKVAKAAEASSQDLLAEAEGTPEQNEGSSSEVLESFYLTKVVKDPPKGARGLLDGGATNSLRTAKSQREIDQCTVTQVSLALGHADLLLTPVGTLVSSEPVAPIVPMGVLAAELGCKISWEGELCQVIHPKRGKLPIVMVNRCPELCAKFTEELIAEIENKRALVMQRALRLRALAIGVGEKGTDEPASVDAMLEWLRKLSPDCPESILARVPPVWKGHLVGEDIPFNRRIRRAVQRADKVVIHLFSGKTKAQDFGQWPSSVYVLSVDLEQGLDILSEGLYQYLLELCSSGKVVAIVGDENSDHPIPAEWTDDDVEGPVPADAEDPFQLDEPLKEDDALDLDPDWEKRAQQWNDRWKATIETLTEPVEVVPLVFVEPISSKRASVTLRGLQRIASIYFCKTALPSEKKWKVPQFLGLSTGRSEFLGGFEGHMGYERSEHLVQWGESWGTFQGGDDQAVWFDSSKRHAVEAAEGDRIVIVAYTPRCLHKCKPQEIQMLQELGFQLPPDVVNQHQGPKLAAQIGQDPQYFDISTDSEEDSSEGEWGCTGEPKDFDQRVARLSHLVREEEKALIEELEQGLTSVTPGLLAELQEDLRVATLLQEQDSCELELERVRSKFALHRLASVERELEHAWGEAEKTGLPQVRAMKVPVDSSHELAGEPSSLLSVGDGPTFALGDSLVPGEPPENLHPDFGLETSEVVEKEACAVPGALLQTRIVSQAEVWKNLEQWRQPLTDEVVALKDLHKAVWAIGPEQLKRLEELAEVSVIPAKGVYTQKPITNRLRARIVGCGNFLESDPPSEDVAKGHVRSQDLYAGGVDGVSVRLQTSVAAIKGWGNASLDIKTAFLGAPLYQDRLGQAVLSPGDLSSGNLDFEMLVRKLQKAQGEKVKIVVVTPPRVLVSLGLIEESEKWLVLKALYGLAEAPRRWSSHRDMLLRQHVWEEGGRRFSLQQCVADNNLWKIVSEPLSGGVHAGAGLETESGSEPMLHGLLGIYVDDMLIIAEESVKERLVKEIRSIWSTSEPESAEEGKPIRFCGFNLHRLKGGGYLLNQEDYVQDLLQRFSDIQGISEVPCLKEEELEPETPSPKQLKRAQALTGALQWITTRTRPDICFAVNRTAQLMSRYPRYATRYAENIIRYLRGTPALGLVFRPLDDQNRFGKCEELTAPRSPGILEVFADASFGPASGKSQTGIIAVFCGSVIAWASHRQSTTAQSSAEAEMYSSMDGVLMIEVLEGLASEVATVPLRKLLYSDSMGCVSLFSAPAGAWRTRHLRLKARAGREKLESQFFEMRHLAGRFMLADVATKALQGQRHRELVHLLEMKSPANLVESVEVRRLRGVGAIADLSCKSSAEVRWGAMGVRALVLAVVLSVVASKLTIIVEDRGGDDGMAKILFAVGAMMAVLAVVLMRRSCVGSSAVETEDPVTVRSMGHRGQSDDEDDQWRTQSPATKAVRTEDLASGSCSSGISGMRESAAPDDVLKISRISGVRESVAQEVNPFRPGVQDSTAQHVDSSHSGVRESVALRMTSGVRESEAPGHGSRSGGKQYQIHPTWLFNAPPRQQWPDPHPWAGVQGHWHQSIPPHVRKDSFLWDPERSVLVRFHAKVRTFRFEPQRAVLPAEVPLVRLTGNRRTYAMFTDGRQLIEEDSFLQPSSLRLSGDWTGRTEFEVRMSQA
ncbi:RE1 [Symbiodinium sp. CCMP2592]|nr:RE1 [Symbiodinium sp. CCMP2592]